ncbi:hypothetical protein IWX90DRAFT_416947 [Phyllosticta citrichinensis]|uniref:Zinc-binding loop region of homing endonuclease domain-containing protein n=1 Tax=Phyllosticta citrichinensis TaxID=1130410 RepID=A0ABR1XP12_9PEZI
MTARWMQTYMYLLERKWVGCTCPLYTQRRAHPTKCPPQPPLHLFPTALISSFSSLNLNHNQALVHRCRTSICSLPSFISYDKSLRFRTLDPPLIPQHVRVCFRRKRLSGAKTGEEAERVGKVLIGMEDAQARVPPSKRQKSVKTEEAKDTKLKREGDNSETARPRVSFAPQNIIDLTADDDDPITNQVVTANENKAVENTAAASQNTDTIRDQSACAQRRQTGQQTRSTRASNRRSATRPVLELPQPNTTPPGDQQVLIDWNMVFVDDEDSIYKNAVSAVGDPRGSQHFSLESKAMLNNVPSKHRAKGRYSERACLVGIIADWDNGEMIRSCQAAAKMWLSKFVGHLHHWDPVNGGTILDRTRQHHRYFERWSSLHDDSCRRDGRPEYQAPPIRLRQIHIDLVIAIGCGLITRTDWASYWLSRLNVSHKCHNVKCITPAHIVLESPAQNSARKSCVAAKIFMCRDPTPPFLIDKVHETYSDSASLRLRCPGASKLNIVRQVREASRCLRFTYLGSGSWALEVLGGVVAMI